MKKRRDKPEPGRKIFGNHLSYHVHEIVPGIDKELSKLNTKRTIQFAMHKGHEPIFRKEDMQVANEHVKRCSASLAMNGNAT